MLKLPLLFLNRINDFYVTPFTIETFIQTYVSVEGYQCQWGKGHTHILM